MNNKSARETTKGLKPALIQQVLPEPHMRRNVHIIHFITGTLRNMY